MKMPSFKEFVDVKNPAMAFAYVLIIAVSILYARSEINNQRRFAKLEKEDEKKGAKIEKLETAVAFFNEQMRRKDSANAALSTRIDVLRELKKI